MITTLLFFLFLLSFWLETVFGVKISKIPGLSLQNIILYIFLILWLIKSLLGGRFINYSKVNKYIIFFCLIAVVSIPVKYLLPEISGLKLTNEIIFLKNWINPFLLFLIICNTVEDKETNNKVFFLLLTFLMVTVLTTIGMVTGVLKIGVLSVKNSRSAGFAEPNQYAAYIVLFFPVVFSGLYAFRQKAINILSMLFIVLTLVSLLMTGSRGGLLALFFGMVYYFYQSARLNMIKILPIIILITLVFPLAFATSFYLAPKAVRVEVLERFDPRNSSDTAELTSGRTLLWARGLKLFLRSPIYGHGQNSFIPLMKKNFRIWGNSHNDYLLYLVDFGLVGLVIFLMIFFSLYREVIELLKSTTNRQLKFFAISYLAGLAGYCFAIFGVNVIQPRYLFWAYSAVALKYVQFGRSEVGETEQVV